MSSIKRERQGTLRIRLSAAWPSRRPMMGAALLLAGTAVFLAAEALGYQQPRGDPFTTAITKVKDRLYVIPGYDGAATGENVAVRVTREGVVIVDDKLTALHADIVSKVKSVSPLPIKYVVNTHQHSDHTGSNAEFLKTAEILTKAQVKAFRDKRA